MDSTHTPNIPITPAPAAPWRSLLRWLVLPPLIVAFLVLCAVVCVSASVIALWPRGTPELVARVAIPPLAVPAKEPARCDGCGTIETITRLGDHAEPATYEFTVRMRNGSARRSSEWPRGHWREGDHVILIGGPDAREAEERDNVER